MKTFKKILLIALAVLLAILLATSAIFGSFLLRTSQRTKALQTDISALAREYPEPIFAGPEEGITQKISCGYAVIELFGRWAGAGETEQELAARHTSVVTSTAAGFAGEMNRVFPQYQTQCLTWLPDDVYLKTICESLNNGIPVPIQWAAPLEDSWTLHYSLVTGADLSGDRITVLNPYGCTEVLTQREFLSRTGFQAYDPMPLWLKLAFALDVFQKNTLFLVTEP